MHTFRDILSVVDQAGEKEGFRHEHADPALYRDDRMATVHGCIAHRRIKTWGSVVQI